MSGETVFVQQGGITMEIYRRDLPHYVSIGYMEVVPPQPAHDAEAASGAAPAVSQPIEKPKAEKKKAGK